MLQVNGTLVFIQQVPAKEYNGKVTPASQKLQIQTIDPDKGIEIETVKDKDFKFGKDHLNKEISLTVNTFSSSDIFLSV